MELGPCTACDRHVRLEDERCPFCGDGAARAPGAIRRVSRRDFTRAAVFVGAAVLGACGGEGEIAYDDQGTDAEETTGGEGADFSSDRDGSGSRGSDDAQDVSQDDAQDDEQDDEQAMDALERERELEEQERWERERYRRNPCVDGVCPPYGTPPARDALV